MGYCKKDVSPLQMHWSYVFLALTHRYKGKGINGKCLNERGITLASNPGKVFERVKNEVHLTEVEAGGIPGSARWDHRIIRD